MSNYNCIKLNIILAILLSIFIHQTTCIASNDLPIHITTHSSNHSPNRYNQILLSPSTTKIVNNIKLGLTTNSEEDDINARTAEMVSYFADIEKCIDHLWNEVFNKENRKILNIDFKAKVSYKDPISKKWCNEDILSYLSKQTNQPKLSIAKKNKSKRILYILNSLSVYQYQNNVRIITTVTNEDVKKRTREMVVFFSNLENKIDILWHKIFKIENYELLDIDFTAKISYTDVVTSKSSQDNILTYFVKQINQSNLTSSQKEKSRHIIDALKNASRPLYSSNIKIRILTTSKDKLIQKRTSDLACCFSDIENNIDLLWEEAIKLKNTDLLNIDFKAKISKKNTNFAKWSNRNILFYFLEQISQNNLPLLQKKKSISIVNALIGKMMEKPSRIKLLYDPNKGIDILRSALLFDVNGVTKTIINTKNQAGQYIVPRQCFFETSESVKRRLLKSLKQYIIEREEDPYFLYVLLQHDDVDFDIKDCIATLANAMTHFGELFDRDLEAQSCIYNIIRFLKDNKCINKTFTYRKKSVTLLDFALIQGDKLRPLCNFLKINGAKTSRELKSIQETGFTKIDD